MRAYSAHRQLMTQCKRRPAANMLCLHHVLHRSLRKNMRFCNAGPWACLWRRLMAGFATPTRDHPLHSNDAMGLDADRTAGRCERQLLVVCLEGRNDDNCGAGCCIEKLAVLGAARCKLTFVRQRRRSRVCRRASSQSKPQLRPDRRHQPVHQARASGVSILTMAWYPSRQ